MTTIKFTARIVKKDKGCYVAHADELPVMAEPARTQRGAIGKLKNAVLARLGEAAQSGKLATVLDDAGYAGDLVSWSDSILECHIPDGDTVLLSLPHSFARMDRRAREKAAPGEGSDAQ